MCDDGFLGKTLGYLGKFSGVWLLGKSGFRGEKSGENFRVFGFWESVGFWGKFWGKFLVFGCWEKTGFLGKKILGKK